MYQSTTETRVRYGETDQMGYLYYGNYALYYEIGRAEAFRALGCTYKSLESIKIHMPVVRVESTYRHPAFYDELITIQTTVKELNGGPRIVFYTDIFNEEHILIHEGKTTLAFFDASVQRIIKMPEVIFQRLKPYFN